MGCCVLPLFALTPKNKMMKELDVKKVSMANIPVEAVPALMYEEKVAFQPVNTVNWAAYPYCPDVKFRIAYTDNAILIHYKVKEASVRAVAGKDNGPVWEDACVEFFSIPAGDGISLNFFFVLSEASSATIIRRAFPVFTAFSAANSPLAILPARSANPKRDITLSFNLLQLLFQIIVALLRNLCF